MSKKTMKDYVSNIKSIHTKNVIINFPREKQCNKGNSQYKGMNYKNVRELSESILSNYKLSKNFESSKKISADQINRKIKRKFAIEKTIDLHGLTKTEAFEAILEFFITCQLRNIRRVLVITGGSNQRNSIIRPLFIEWINKYFHQYISTYTTAKSAHGGEGAFYVTLKINN